MYVKLLSTLNIKFSNLLYIEKFSYFAGGAYLPIEVSYPLPLLQSVIEDSEPVAICAKSQFAEKLYQFYDRNRVILLEGKWSDKFKLLPSISTTVQSTLDDLAYTVYSSGTTGKPKGAKFL